MPCSQRQTRARQHQPRAAVRNLDRDASSHAARSPGPSVTASAARRSYPASPSCARSGALASGERRVKRSAHGRSPLSAKRSNRGAAAAGHPGVHPHALRRSPRAPSPPPSREARTACRLPRREPAGPSAAAWRGTAPPRASRSSSSPSPVSADTWTASGKRKVSSRRRSGSSRSALFSASSRGRSAAPISTSLLHGVQHLVQLPLGHGGVGHVQEQVCLQGLLERGREGVDELVGQLSDEADGVGEQVLAPLDLERARGGVEGVEQVVAHAHLRARQSVQQCGLARIRVAGEGHRRQPRALALGAHHLAGALRVLQPAPQRADAIAGEPAVRLDLGLARAPGADAAVHTAGAEPLEVRPQPAHAREVVLQLRQLHLELALGRRGVVGEDVEDDCGAVDHRRAECLLEVALLARQQLVVHGDHVRVGGPDRRLQLAQLALAEIAVRIGRRALLDHLPHHPDARGGEQLAEFLEVRLVGTCGDHQRALARPGGSKVVLWHSHESRPS